MSGPLPRPLTTKESDGSVVVRPTTTLSFNEADFTISKTGSEATVSIDSTGTGAALTATQVGFGDASNLLTGNSKFRYLESAGQLILTGTNDTNAEFLIERSSGSGQTIGLENDSSASPTLVVNSEATNAKLMRLDNQIDASAVSAGTQGFTFNMGNTSDTSISMLTITTTDSVAYDVVFNEDSLNDYDVRIEGATDPNLFVADGSQDAIGIGTFPAAGVKLHIKDEESDTDNVVVRIQDASVDSIGDQVAIEGYWNTAEAGRIQFELRDTTTAASALVFKLRNDAGSLTEFLRIDGDAKAVTFNEQSEDVDFRVETNNNGSTLRIVGSTDNVGIATVPESSALLHIAGDGTKSFDLLLESTDTDANNGPVLALWRNSASPANNDDCGSINWYFENSAGSRHLVGRLRSEITEITAGSEDSRLYFTVFKGGTEVQSVAMKHSEVVINDGSHDINFRVESDSNANMLVVDAGIDMVGIGSNPVSTFTQDPPFQIPNQSGPASYAYIIPSTTSPMTLTNNDLQSPLLVHDSATNLTINLPLDGGVKGQYFRFVSTGGNVTIVPAAAPGDTINGSASSVTRSTDNQIYECVCIANNTWIVSNP